MPILSILTQPAASSLNAAYSPLIFRIQATDNDGAALPPVVYCDIYFNGIYYRSLTKTQAESVALANSNWIFDIRSTAQEFLTKYLPALNGSVIAEGLGQIAAVLIKFRSSGSSIEGFITPEGTAPVQATGSSPAIAGTGFLSNAFYVVNAALQRSDNTVLTTHLNAYKYGTWIPGAYPLSHRPARYFMNEHQSDYYPVVVDSTICVGMMKLLYRYRGQSTVRYLNSGALNPCNVVIQTIHANQVPGTTDFIISWTHTGLATSFQYRLNGGIWLTTPSSPITLYAIVVGAPNTVEIKGICVCGEGPINDGEFTAADPAVFNCNDSSIIDLAADQTGPGEANITFTIIGGAVAWEALITPANGGPLLQFNGSAAQQFFTAQGMALGFSDIEVWPICANEVFGTSQKITKKMLGFPLITKIDEYNTGPGGIRTQVFRMGGIITTGNRFMLVIYGIPIIYTTNTLDTPLIVAAALRDLINATTAAQWNAAALAPAPGTNGFPPVASSVGADLTVTMDYMNAFSYYAYFS